MSNLKNLHLLQDHQGHPGRGWYRKRATKHMAISQAKKKRVEKKTNKKPGNLSSVDVPVLYWQPWHHHVGVPDCLNLIFIKIITGTGWRWRGPCTRQSTGWWSRRGCRGHWASLQSASGCSPQISRWSQQYRWAERWQLAFRLYIWRWSLPGQANTQV